MVARPTRTLTRLLEFSWFERHREYAPLFVRLIVGFHLVYNTADNVFSYGRMLEFERFLAGLGFPYPLFNAFLSAYAQFICGLLFMLGAFVRPAAVVMIVNFVVALLTAHVGVPYNPTFPALMMLLASVSFLFSGAGALSVDAALHRRRHGGGRAVAGAGGARVASPT